MSQSMANLSGFRWYPVDTAMQTDDAEVGLLFATRRPLHPGGRFRFVVIAAILQGCWEQFAVGLGL